MKDGHLTSNGAVELADLPDRSPGRDGASDGDAITKLHHKPTIPRTLDRLIGLIGVNSSVVSAWPDFFLTSVISLSNGGTAGLLVGVIIASLGMVPVYIGLAEKIRRYPTAGGQYHWVAGLAPPRIRRVLSFYCGFVLGQSVYLCPSCCPVAHCLYSAFTWMTFLAANVGLGALSMSSIILIILAPTPQNGPLSSHFLCSWSPWPSTSPGAST